MLPVVILAAGEGRRMGGPKVRLVVDGRPVLTHIVARLNAAGLKHVVCVVQPSDAVEIAALGSGAQVVVNPHPERGMLASLAAGVAVMGTQHGVMVAHIDHPHVAASTYAALAEAHSLWPECVIKPVASGRTGHPLILPASLLTHLPDSDIDGGLRTVLQRIALPERCVEVQDEGIHHNINTQQDHAVRFP